MLIVLPPVVVTPRLTHLPPLQNIHKIAGLTYPKIYSPWVVVFRLWAYPTIVLSSMVYIFTQYWWVIALLTIEPLAYADKTPQVQGLLFLGFAAAALAGAVPGLRRALTSAR